MREKSDAAYFDEAGRPVAYFHHHACAISSAAAIGHARVIAKASVDVNARATRERVGALANAMAAARVGAQIVPIPATQRAAAPQPATVTTVAAGAAIAAAAALTAAAVATARPPQRVIVQDNGLPALLMVNDDAVNAYNEADTRLPMPMPMPAPTVNDDVVMA